MKDFFMSSRRLVFSLKGLFMMKVDFGFFKLIYK